MDVAYSEQVQRYRDEIRRFLDEHLPADWAGVHRLADAQRDRWIDQWRALLSDRGLLAPAWPTAYGGGGLSHLEEVVLHEEFTRAGVPAGAPTGRHGRRPARDLDQSPAVLEGCEHLLGQQRDPAQRHR